MSTTTEAGDGLGIHEPPALPTPADSPEFLGDPAVIGVPTFVVGSIALGLTLVGFVPAEAVGAPLAIILAATGIGQLVAATWATRLGQNAPAAIFGIFAGFWLSYGLLVLGLTHDWFGLAEADAAIGTQELFLLSWLIAVLALTFASLRLPLAFTVLFVLVDVALALVLLGTMQESPGLTQLGGIFVFGFTAVGVYLFFNVMSLATGGPGLSLGNPIKR